MRSVKRGVVVAVLAALWTAGPAAAVTPPIFQALGWIQGEGSVSSDSVSCEIPTITSGFTDGSFEMGLWNTFGEPTISFPNRNSAFANPCGGWIHLVNNLANQGILLERLVFKFKIQGARRFRQFVPTRRGFPLACRQFRKEVRFVSARLNAVNSSMNTPSGAPNVAFVNPVPFISAQLFSCLRAQYAPLPLDVFTSLPLLIRTTAFGITDLGESVQSNTINYTLTLRHLCGNGRVDDGEVCDPAAPNTCFDLCEEGSCLLTGAPCAFSTDCGGICLPGNDPQECSCAF